MSPLKDPNEPRLGHYEVSSGKSLLGELRTSGRESSITIRDTEPIGLGGRVHLQGVLFDQTKVTLASCVLLNVQSRHGVGGVQSSHTATLFPHFIVEGRSHFDPDAKVIEEIQFSFDDAPVLFHDFDAFGSVDEPQVVIAQLTGESEGKRGRKIRTGKRPLVAYFGGEEIIVDFASDLGRITARHAPSCSIGGPRGVRIDNEIWLSIGPPEPVTLEEAVSTLMSFLRLIGIAVGREQEIRHFRINVATHQMPEILNVHWSHHPPFSHGAKKAAHHFDLPLDPVHRTDEFVNVATNWLAHEIDRQVARVRAVSSFVESDIYSVDRLVGIANAFDLLPESAVPQRTRPSEEVLQAKQECKAIFRKLPASDERTTLLNALGRIGQATLKQKVRHRAGLLMGADQARFELLDWVCDHAVDCRNHFVHGSPVALEIYGPRGALGFLTDTLEFVFVASEMVECGWDINSFIGRPTSTSHPLAEYCWSYTDQLKLLRSRLANTSDLIDDGDTP